MVFRKEWIFFSLTLTGVFLAKISQSAPPRKAGDVDAELNDFLDSYYEKFVRNSRYESEMTRRNAKKNSDIYDVMQGDQPVEERNFTTNASDINVLKAARNRTKDNWIQMLKINILQQVGRANTTLNAPGESRLTPLNLTQLFPYTPNETNPAEDLISKKLKTFYPSCSVPEAAELEFRNDDKLMNLFFNYTEDDQANKLATATLRLHRLPSDVSNTTSYKPKNCTTLSNEEEKLLRISIYWYLKPQKNKRRGKKRLCDSKVIPESSKWVELNVANAIKSWTKDQNLGLAIQVEDQDGRTVKAEKYFKGPTCTVGVSTPKPIPTILVDNARTPDQLDRLLGRNSTPSLSGDLLLLPTVDVCTLGLPVNYSNVDLATLQTDACSLRQLHEQAQKLLEKDKLERLATLTSNLKPSTTNHRHLRHQRNYIEEKLAESDTRILMTKEQVFKLLQSLNLTNTT